MGVILQLIHLYAAMYHMDPYLVQAVVQYESSYRTTVVGKKGEVGLMQLMPSTVHKNKAQLMDPAMNIKLGVEYLSKLRSSCKYKDDFEFLVCFNLGEAGGKSIKHPRLFPYYKHVMSIYHHLKEGNHVKDLSV